MNKPITQLSLYCIVFITISLLQNQISIWSLCLFFYQFPTLVLELLLTNSKFASERTSLIQKKSEFCREAANQVKSFIHAFIASSLSLYLFYSNQLIDHIHTTTPISRFLCIQSSMYFLGDFIDILRKPTLNTQDVTMLFHHLCAGLAFFVAGYTNLFHYFVALILLFEISTIFLKLRWWMIQLRSNLLQFVQCMFIFTFVGVRILWGYFVLTPLVLLELMYVEAAGLVKVLAMVTILMVFIGNFINLFFLYKIILMVRRTVK